MDVRTNSEEPPTSPAGDEAGGDEHAEVLGAAEERAADEAEDGAVNYAGFAALGVHDIGGGENPQDGSSLECVNLDTIGVSFLGSGGCEPGIRHSLYRSSFLRWMLEHHWHQLSPCIRVMVVLLWI
jgi:hypothetical protein